ncbi:hypothetical protein HBN50_10665 [Halobacteriovorax sp. GB3]|uniref:CFI-box-CTERM domain-containing protein n=1 Tax=Halobacteriovorax sp. GB3 TaxID=2719615 RepID=UPI00235E6077|nr:CFI-box-CTERM domain-containing protein [Halobacteriovorax sp. GB3]MDD0853564.1 hypothetical protein [Halobacteriovorax sp. GB3]
MNKLTILILTFLMSFNSYSLSVVLTDSDEPVVRMVKTTSYDLVIEGKSGSSVSEPYEVFVAVDPNGSSTTDQNKYFTKSNGDLATISAGTVRFFVDVDVDSDEKKLFVAARDGSDTDFDMVYLSTANFSSDTDSQALDVPMSNLCGSPVDCASDGFSDSSQQVEKDQIYYIGLVDTDTAFETGLNPEADEYKGGVYVRINFSTKLDETVVISLSTVEPGDESVYVTYETSSTTISDRYDTIFISDGTGNAPFHGTSGSESPTILFESETAGVSDSVQIPDLSNGVTYNITVAYRNKYFFATPQSDSLTGQPQEIPPFLKKNACYFISAGFGEDHYVLDYFRSIRDEVLLQNSFGKRFVNFYYTSAPKYAQYIYENKYLAFSVRIFSYISYFAIKHFYYIMALITLILSLLIVKKRGNVVSRKKELQS